ncbi:putative inactive metalloprotease YmfF [Collibacillus ludicampi]|uniref:Inactive metalloprotease YmfF n=1 Tax=Collibacillus ludicampi TaxID=2771369 RepID=A0AAV4LAR1_9BACL|nr:pitrilysin family protein [Collibacillus ludicampi]GIM44858.1 putative inactive metalloprotease YmfF [Collibacillus ludicampi]
MKNFVTRGWNGLSVHVLPTEKFKMTTIAVNLQTDLEEDKATKVALIPHVLMRGSQTYPQSEHIQQTLANLYGASLSVGVAKKGEQQVIEFQMKIANEKYLGTGEPLLEQGIDLLVDVLLRPALEDGAFVKDFLEKEKEQHIKRIDSLFDDKIQYAVERCLSEMTKGERYAIPRLGQKEDLQKIDAQTLYDAYRDLLRTAPMNLMVVGHVEPERVWNLFASKLQLERASVRQLQAPQIVPRAKDVKEVIDRQDVTQGKLNIGFRTGGLTYQSDQYPALLVYNGIFGGFPHSKLFVNVREKSSLAYYASSRLDSIKGLLYVQSGIEIANYEKAVSIIKEQFEAMRNGQIDERELEFTKNGLINQFRTLMDSPEAMIDIYLNGLVAGRQWIPEDLCEQVARVTIEDVVEVAKQISLDTIYFLRDKEERAHA